MSIAELSQRCIKILLFSVLLTNASPATLDSKSSRPYFPNCANISLFIHNQEVNDMAVMRTVKKVKDLVTPATGAHEQEVEFSFHAPDAKRVCVAGTFNDWNTNSMPLKKEKDGTWRKKVKLAPGRYEYKYFVDGVWIQGTPCAETALNPFGTYNCVIGVKAA
jgi:hypothetical protein